MSKHKHATPRGTYTFDRIETGTEHKPEFASVEVATRISGIGRGSIYKGLANGHFESVFLRERAYLHSLAAEGIDEDRSGHGFALRRKAKRSLGSPRVC